MSEELEQNWRGHLQKLLAGFVHRIWVWFAPRTEIFYQAELNSMLAESSLPPQKINN